MIVVSEGLGGGGGGGVVGAQNSVSSAAPPKQQSLAVISFHGQLLPFEIADRFFLLTCKTM